MKNSDKFIIDNATGKRLIEKNRLNYSMEILKLLKSNPEIIDNVIKDLEIDKASFFKKLSGEEKGNISFYDDSYQTINKLLVYKKMYEDKNDKKIV